jgi:mannosyltransferase
MRNLHSRFSLLLLAPLIFLAGWLRFSALTARSIWFDESFTWRLLQFPWLEIIQRTARDVHPPLYYLLLKIWSSLWGSSLFSLRSFSVLISLLLIVATYYFAAQLLRSRRTGFFASALLSVAGWHVYLSQEARMYSLGALLALLSTWLLWRASQKTGRQAVYWYLVYGLSAAALLYTHYYGFFTLASHALWLILLSLSRRDWRLTFHSSLGWLTAALLFLPWLPTFQAQRAQVSDSFWIPDLTVWTVPDTFFQMFFPTLSLNHEGLGAIIILLPGVSLLLLTLFSLFKDRSSPLASRLSLIALSGFGPVLLSLGISLLGRSVYQDRYFIFAYTFLIVLIAHFFSRLPSAKWRTLAFSTFFLLLLASTWRYYWQLDLPTKPGSRAAVDSVYSQRAAHEPILVGSSFIYFSVAHYAAENFPSSLAPRLYSPTGSGEVAHFAGGPLINLADFLGPEALLATNSLWIVDTTGFGGQETALSPDWQPTSKLYFSEVFPFQGEIIVTRYQRAESTL